MAQVGHILNVDWHPFQPPRHQWILPIPPNILCKVVKGGYLFQMKIYSEAQHGAIPPLHGENICNIKVPITPHQRHGLP